MNSSIKKVINSNSNLSVAPIVGDSIENLVEKQEKVKCKHCKTTFEKILLEKNI